MVACMTASGRWSPSANVPARGVEHRGDRPGVQEPVVLGEPVVVAQQQLYPARLDVDHVHAERGHHALPVEMPCRSKLARTRVVMAAADSVPVAWPPVSLTR